MKSESPESKSNGNPKNKLMKREFVCGVVEGFYGRPWTTEKRRDLFTKMENWGMNSYLYAPKDDCKHRAYWRELYTVEEAEHLQSLITLASECNIDFYYAISPGLDITYSSSKEMLCLKRKLEQVSQLGCKSFALLFDDIEPEMCKNDKEVFQSFAHAQVTVTNDIYQHLGETNFMFCPTQYCTARAVPTVKNSEYLKTLGSNLAPDIKIMWTGDKVISKIISKKTLEDINEVLKRKVVIWDNEHANDYDQKRVFLGPYSGRSPEIISELSGVMTNPNCEYWANFVAIHTLAQWSKCKIDGTGAYSNASDVVSADIKLEIQACDGSDVHSLSSDVYHPKNALIKAVTEWIPEFSVQKTVWGPMSKPQVGLSAQPVVPVTTVAAPNMNGTTSNPQTLPSTASSSGNPAEQQGMVPEAAKLSINAGPSDHHSSSASDLSSATNAILEQSSALVPVSLPVMNSLVSTNKVVVDNSLIEASTTDNAVGSQSNTSSAMTAPTTTYPDMPTPTLMPPPSAPHGMPPPVAPVMPIPDDIIPGPTYLEPMDTMTSNSASPAPTMKMDGHESTKVHNDIPMESLTSPPTPGSTGMQIESSETSNLHKTESSTMICEAPYAPPGASSSASVSLSMAGNVSQVSRTSISSTNSSLIPTHGENITNNPEVTTMLCEEVCTDIKEMADPQMSVQDLVLLCQLFFLPADHGQIGIELLEDFFWLKKNASTMLPPGTVGAGTTDERMEWEHRAAKFKSNVLEIHTLFVKLCSCQNRELVYDLYTYLWDMCGVIQTLEGFVQWISKGCCSPKCANYVLGQQTWFSGLKEAFCSGDHEPWMFRGGLVSDLLRLLPLDSGNDLYNYKFPEVPQPLLYYVRPFQPRDEDAVYTLTSEMYEKTIDAPMGLCQSDKNLIGDKFVGAYLTLCPEYTFVCENSLTGSIVGFVCAAPDAKTFYTRHTMAWLPEMRLKYPFKKLSSVEVEMMSPIEQMAQSFHNPGAEQSLPNVVLNPSPSGASTSPGTPSGEQPWGMALMRMNLEDVNELSVAKRLTMLLLACLRASGTLRVFVETERQQELYANLGFNPMPEAEENEKGLFMSRSF